MSITRRKCTWTLSMLMWHWAMCNLHSGWTTRSKIAAVRKRDGPGVESLLTRLPTLLRDWWLKMATWNGILLRLLVLLLPSPSLFSTQSQPLSMMTKCNFNWFWMIMLVRVILKVRYWTILTMLIKCCWRTILIMRKLLEIWLTSTIIKTLHFHIWMS